MSQTIAVNFGPQAVPTDFSPGTRGGENESGTVKLAAILTRLAQNAENLQQALAFKFTPDLFRDALAERSYRLAFSVLTEFFKRHGKLPLQFEMFLECHGRVALDPLEFAGAETALATLIENVYVDAPASWEYVRGLIAEELYKRRVNPLSAILNDLGPTPDSLRDLQDALADVAALRAGTIDSDCRLVAEWLKDAAVLNAPPRISTTYKALDAALNGGLTPGGLYLIVALTSRGKSATAVNMARRAALADLRTLLITLEATPQLACRQMLAQEAKIPVVALEKSECLSPEQKNALDAAIVRIQALPLEVEGNQGELSRLEQLIRRKAAAGTKLFFVDQSSWVEAEGADTAYEEASEIARRMKKLARELNIVIVMLVQVNRAGAGARSEGKPIELQHIRDSGRWEQDCDGALILQGLVKETTPARLTIEVAKHRHGPHGMSCQLLFTLALNLIEDDPDALVPTSATETTASDKKSDKANWRATDLIANGCVNSSLSPRALILEAAMNHEMFDGGKPMARSRAEKLFQDALELGLIHEWQGGKFPQYSTSIPPAQLQPAPTVMAAKPMSKRAKVEAVIRARPNATAAEIISLLGADIDMDDSYVRRIRRDMEKEHGKVGNSGTNGTSVPPSESRP